MSPGSSLLNRLGEALGLENHAGETPPPPLPPTAETQEAPAPESVRLPIDMPLAQAAKTNYAPPPKRPEPPVIPVRVVQQVTAPTVAESAAPAEQPGDVGAEPEKMAENTDETVDNYLGGWFFKWMSSKTGYTETAVAGPEVAALPDKIKADPGIETTLASKGNLDIKSETSAIRPQFPVAKEINQKVDAYLGGWFFKWMGRRVGLIDEPTYGESDILSEGRTNWPALAATTPHRIAGSREDFTSDFSMIDIDIVPPAPRGTVRLPDRDMDVAALLPNMPVIGRMLSNAEIPGPELGDELGGLPAPRETVEAPATAKPEDFLGRLTDEIAATTPSVAKIEDQPAADSPAVAPVVSTTISETERSAELADVGDLLPGDNEESPAAGSGSEHPVVGDTPRIVAKPPELSLEDLGLADSLEIVTDIEQAPAIAETAAIVEDADISAPEKLDTSGAVAEDTIELPINGPAEAAPQLAALDATQETLPPAAVADALVASRKLPDTVLTLGESLHLAATMPPAPDDPSEANYCIEKVRGELVFCIEPVDWPPSLASELRVSSIMYQGARAVVRYDHERATRLQAIFPNEVFDTVVAYYTGRFGPPIEVNDQTIAPFAEPRRENPVKRWNRQDPISGKDTMLEIRLYDDTRGGFPDLRHSALMLYNADSPPIFPTLSALDLMPTSGSN